MITPSFHGGKVERNGMKVRRLGRQALKNALMAKTVVGLVEYRGKEEEIASLRHLGVGPGEKVEADQLSDGRIIVRAAAQDGTIDDFIA